MPIPGYHPKPAPPGVFGGQPLPEGNRDPISRLTFQWIAPIMKVGYSRPLELEDLWALPDSLQCQNIANRLEEHFLLRLPPSKSHHTSQPAPEHHVPTNPSSPSEEASTMVDSSSSERRLSVVSSRAFKPPVREPNDAGKEMALIEAIDEVTGPLDNTGLEGDIEGNIPHHPPPSRQPTFEATARPERGDEAIHSETLPVGLSKRKGEEVAKGKIVFETGRKYDQTLLKAMYLTVWKRWWAAVILKGCGAMLQVTAPLVTRLIIEQISMAHAYHEAQMAGSDQDLPPPRPVGYGAGLAAGLFGMLMVASLLVYQALQIGSVIGFMMRSALIDLIGRKSMCISSKARLDMTNGHLTTMVSADASFLDFSAPMTLDLVVQPIQILVGIALLIYTLGYSALVGLAVLAVAGPVQAFMFAQMVKYRQAQLVHVDARVRLLSEIIENIRAVKLYAYGTRFHEALGCTTDSDDYSTLTETAVIHH